MLNGLARGLTLGQAAIQAGFSEKNAAQSGYQCFKVIEAKFPQILERMGLTDSSIIDRYLRPALEATETKFFSFKGEIQDEREVIAWDVRTRALDMLFQLKGSYAPKEIEHKGLIIHAITDGERAEALSSIEKIQSLDSSSSTPILAEYAGETESEQT